MQTYIHHVIGTIGGIGSVYVGFHNTPISVSYIFKLFNLFAYLLTYYVYQLCFIVFFIVDRDFNSLPELQTDHSDPEVGRLPCLRLEFTFVCIYFLPFQDTLLPNHHIQDFRWHKLPLNLTCKFSQ